MGWERRASGGWVGDEGERMWDRWLRGRLGARGTDPGGISPSIGGVGKARALSVDILLAPGAVVGVLSFDWDVADGAGVDGGRTGVRTLP